MKPCWPPTDAEGMLVPADYYEIEYDSDHVRAMIARLLQYSGWTLIVFCRTLGPTRIRKKVIDFLIRRGPKEGARLHVYQLAWEFFQMRELLGEPLPSSAKGTRV